MLHAVGLSWAERLQGSDRIALTLFGDGATSEGDFHEAMNFAAVYQLGCVFLCQNNGWAISMPTEHQTASDTIAQKAIAYGMPGVQVDGNDLFGVFEVTREAVERARAGEGPTLIEAVTFRLGPHTAADDSSRYRPDDLAKEWRRRDPLERVRVYLSERERWNPELQDKLEANAATEVERAVQLAESLPPFAVGRIFEAMFEEIPSHLAEQRAQAEIFEASRRP